MRPITCAFFCLLLMTSSIFALDPSDYEKINQIIENTATAWNENDGHGFADDYSQDADFVNIFGMTFKGKEVIENRHVKILETFLKGSIYKVTNIQLREVKPDVVIGHVYWQVTNIQTPNDSHNESMKGVFTHVFVKNLDKWEITASQNTVIAQ